MNRIILCFAIALVAIAPVRSAWADDPAPTKEQLDAAKKAFGEGKALYDAGKIPEAVEKFKESYRLSRNPLLLFNIGHALDQAGQKDKALFYYRKFLSDAPPAAVQRKEVTKRVEAIEKENLEPEHSGTTTNTAPQPKPEEPKQVKIKPAGTYSANDFQHQLVEAAPPGKPLDVSAFVPEDSGFQVTLYYRGAGDSKFTAKPMKWRYKELVGRIPSKMMAGSSIQYYIDVKDQSGNMVTRSGKSTSPNLINIEAGAPPRFYADMGDESAAEPAPAEVKQKDESEDPLARKSHQAVDTEFHPDAQEPTKGGGGLTDVGSSKFNKAKWISTATAGVLVGGAAVFYILAAKQASNLEDDAFACGTPPCREFDSGYDLEVQNAGQRYNTLYQITAITSLVAVGVAGYFWVREMTGKKRQDVNAKNKTSSADSSWAVSPTIGEGLVGAAAAARF